jgi:Spy/CpxP family protein refolding chaperone
MKRKLILTFLAYGASAMLGVAAQAQDTPALVSSTTAAPSASPESSPGPWAGHKHGHGGGILQHLTTTLDLSGTQQAQIATILESARPQMKALHEDFKAKRAALIQSVSAQITPLLTPDQQAKFSGMVQKFEAGPGHGGHGGKAFARRGAGGGGPADMLQKLSTQLSLTADQQSQIRPILDAAHTQMQSIHQDTSLTPAQKFAKVRETMQGVRSQINGILTPAQQQQLAALKEQYHHKRFGEGQPAASPSPSPATN